MLEWKVLEPTKNPEPPPPQTEYLATNAVLGKCDLRVRYVDWLHQWEVALVSGKGFHINVPLVANDDLAALRDSAVPTMIAALKEVLTGLQVLEADPETLLEKE